MLWVYSACTSYTLPSYNLGVDPPTICISKTTGVSLHCVDAFTGEPLAGQRFLVKEVSVPPLFSIPQTLAADTIRTDQWGRASSLIPYQQKEAAECTLRHIDEGDWYCMAEYGMLRGCDTECAPVLKQAVPMVLVIRNTGATDLGVLSLRVSTLPSAADLQGLFKPIGVQIKQQSTAIGSFPAGRADTVLIKVLPQESNLIELKNLSGPVFYASDTIYPNLSPGPHILLLRN